jgi:catechol 2,3-dioxygenase-like lactoylglutathione lyase family enzyme
MRFHHMCIVTANMDGAIAFWRDFMGFELKIDRQIPDGPAPGPAVLVDPQLLDDIFKVNGARSRVAVVTSDEGAQIELQEPSWPNVSVTPPERQRYADTGVHELALTVKDIDGFFDKVRAHGFETQTDYVWSSSTRGRSFIFYDPEGNMIQMWEEGSNLAFPT